MDSTVDTINYPSEVAPDVNLCFDNKGVYVVLLGKEIVRVPWVTMKQHNNQLTAQGQLVAKWRKLGKQLVGPDADEEGIEDHEQAAYLEGAVMLDCADQLEAIASQ